MLRTTAGRRRTFVFYDDWFVDAETVVARLADFLHVDPSVAWSARLAAVAESGLHRHRSSELELAEARHVPIEVRALYFLMRDLAAAEACGAARGEPLQAVAAAMDHKWGAEERFG